MFEYYKRQHPYLFFIITIVFILGLDALVGYLTRPNLSDEYKSAVECGYKLGQYRVSENNIDKLSYDGWTTIVTIDSDDFEDMINDAMISNYRIGEYIYAKFKIELSKDNCSEIRSLFDDYVHELYQIMFDNDIFTRESAERYINNQFYFTSTNKELFADLVNGYMDFLYNKLS